MRVNEVLGILVSVFLDWDGTLANLNCARVGSTIAWNGFEPAILPPAMTPTDVAELAARRQYTFQIVEDGSPIQLVYGFNTTGEDLVSAHLAYYQAGTTQDQAEYPSEFAPVPWLRIDYDRGRANNVLHGECHLHVSGLPTARLLVCGVPNPKQFVEFILAVFYPTMYRQARLQENGDYVDLERIKRVNEPPIVCGSAQLFRLMTHLRVSGGDS